MAKQNSTELLKEKIKLLEIRQKDDGIALKAQFAVTAEGLKPINLIKNAAKEFATTEELMGTVIESSAILVSGLISKKIMDSTKGGPFVKLLTSLLQLGVTGLAGKYNFQIQDFLFGLVERFLNNKKEVQSE